MPKSRRFSAKAYVSFQGKENGRVSSRDWASNGDGGQWEMLDCDVNSISKS